MASTHPLLTPYIPSESDPFDDVKAAHLLNRAGFGGTVEEVQKVRKMGPGNAADWMLDFPDAPSEEEDGGDSPNLSAIAGGPANFRQYARQLVGKTPEEKKRIIQQFMQANRQAIEATIGWWLSRMAFGKYPLQEKLTFFWHGHFTTSAKDERAAILMWRQNELLRQNAAGNFEPFVRAISRDPAMLDYLNNNENRKAHPNENYARELMELFTLGIGNYSEDDIRQAARAFTGWGHDGADFVYRRGQHDEGIKTFFGRSGNFDGDDIITFILEHPACPRFIAGELFKYLAYEDIDQDLSAALGQLLYGNQYELRPTVRTILTSRVFYSPQSIGVQIKCPVQARGWDGEATGAFVAAADAGGLFGIESDGSASADAAERARLAGGADVDQYEHAVHPVQYGGVAGGWGRSGAGRVGARGTTARRRSRRAWPGRRISIPTPTMPRTRLEELWMPGSRG